MTGVWIDVATGTWGVVEDLRVLDLDQLALEQTQAGEEIDAASLIAFLNVASDSEIIEVGYKDGASVGGVTDIYQNFLQNRREAKDFHFSTVGCGPHPGKEE